MFSVRFLCVLFSFTLLIGCATPVIKPVEIPVSAETREKQLSQINSWKIRGKIAFITQNERESANLVWLKQPSKQKMNVSTALGINVFSLNSEDGLHTVKIDGKNYQGRDLDHLLTNVTGYQLPIGPLEKWLKGIHHSSHDQFSYHSETMLPTTLQTQYMSYDWIIEYSKYGLERDLALAYNLKIRRDGLTIILRIYEWEILN